MSALTTSEVDQYCRLTLKQYNLTDYKIVWKPNLKRALGMANPWEKQIELSPRILASFDSFKQTFLHELAHILQFSMMGGTYKVNGRNDFHGKAFKQACKIVGISSCRCHPIHLPLVPHEQAKKLLTHN